MDTDKQYQLRVVEEKEVLNEKYDKLNFFMTTEKFKDEISAAEQKRLRRQLIYMGLYADVLAERIEKFT